MKYLSSIFNLSLAVLLAVGFFLLGLNSIQTAWDGGLLNQITLVIMLASLLVWLIGWIAFDAFEAQEVDDSFNKFITPG
ncbi:MAG TPA: hypothetical protein VKA34_05575, partial [Balneolales bacterium]|nr:hypothetical protein [Balneolales bacterium]